MIRSDFEIHLGRRTNTDGVCGQQVSLSEQQWSTHCAIIGPTGAGKSRLMWQMMREHRRQRRGFCCIDPGDLAADFLADCAAEVLLENNHALLKKLYWIKLNPFRMPRYDPWKFQIPDGLHPEMRQGVETCWRHKRVQQFMQVLQANVTGSTDFMNQPRRQRMLTNAFTALSIAVEDRHLAMEDVFIFFDPSHKDHRRVLDRCVPFLPSEIRRELEMLGGFKRLGDLWQQVESSVNSLRALLGPCMKAMLSATGPEPSFDWNEAVQRGGYVIVDAHQEYAGHAENVALATLMALDLGETMLNTPRAKRKKFTLFVDEAAEFLGPLGKEFGRWLRIMRKYGMPCVLAFQDLSSMQRDELDLTPVILGQCGTIMCFRNRWHTDNEILARVLLTGNLQFIPLKQDVYQQRGEYNWLRMQEVSRSVKHDENASATHGTTASSGNTQTLTEGKTQNESTALGGSESKVYGANSKVISTAKGSNASGGSGHGSSSGIANATAQSTGTSESATTGSSNGWAVSVGEKLLPLPIVVHDVQKTGQLEESIADQNEKHRQLLHGLDDRHVVVLAPGMKKAVEIVTADVADPFQSADAQAKAVKWIEGKICEAHAFYFVPSFDAADQEKRVDTFVGESASPPEIPTPVPLPPPPKIAKAPPSPPPTKPELPRDRKRPSKKKNQRDITSDAPADKEIPFDD